MLETITILCLSGALITLCLLSYIDIKTFLLPNKLVGSLATLALILHITRAFDIISLHDATYGALAGFWTLYIIRALGNAYYKQDSLGLGDVKLLGAAGIWLGLEGVFFAITLGAFAGLIHGLIYAGYLSIKHQKPFSISRLRIPAGPGFATGIIFVGFWIYGSAFLKALHSLI